MLKKYSVLLSSIGLLLFFLVGCASAGTAVSSEPEVSAASNITPTAEETPTEEPRFQVSETHAFAPSTLMGNTDQIYAQSNDIVSLSQTTLEWETYAYELEEDFTVVPGSFDAETTMMHTFDAWVMENEYLKVTIVPEFGGRILSMIYKPTGREELYQNPIGIPYLIDRGVFYYDWLMIYGGIFPTFPEPEHGKTWLLPWDFEIVEETADKVTIVMSITDDIDNAAPRQYTVGKTGVEAKFYVTLRAGRAAVDTRIELTNTTGSDTDFEYWTNVGFAPGSKVGDPATNEHAIIVTPAEQIRIPGFYDHIAEDEQQIGSNGVYEFDALREFQNWSDEGIAYAYPDVSDTTFWGVINTEFNEGLIRIADNSITKGLKMWTFGYPQSSAINPFRSDDYDRPMIELWAGLTEEFWIRDTFPGNETIAFEETYAPSINMQNVTHANENMMLNMAIVENEIWAEMFPIWPDIPIVVEVLDAEGEVISDALLRPNARRGGRFRLDMPDTATELRFTNEAGTVLFTNEIVRIDEVVTE